MIVLCSVASDRRNNDICQILTRCICVQVYFGLDVSTWKSPADWSINEGCQIRDWIVRERDKKCQEIYISHG